ncbi:Wzz/FepE/Etk N-terminal domain-containing protein [Aeromicrobium sp. NPDC092404]|uniref:Wzz/FepE/Etk N-terminal domain-containing protein n=1 Tax=Aeromicrobium sp. NPDC092404 TaxID=3154976 RepID=UPI003421FC53
MRASTPLTLSELGRAVARGWRLLAVIAVAGVAAGVALHVALPQTYSATASVRVQPTGVDPLAPSVPQSVDTTTEATIAASRRIAGSRSVEVTADGESSVLLITHTAESPSSAARGANAVAEAYLADRSRRAAKNVARLRSTLTQQVRALPDTTSAAHAQVVADLARARRLQVDGGAVIDAARAPDRADRPTLPLSAAAGGLLGLLAAVPVAALGARPGRMAGVVVLDVEPSASTQLRRGAVALADHVLVVRESDADIGIAEQWCRHLESVGIPADVIRAGTHEGPEC